MADGDDIGRAIIGLLLYFAGALLGWAAGGSRGDAGRPARKFWKRFKDGDREIEIGAETLDELRALEDSMGKGEER